MPQLIDAKLPTTSGVEPAPSLIPPELARGDTWTDEEVALAGLPVETVMLATVGGGLASFALIDQLRICGAPTSDLAVVTSLEHPYEAFREYARNSQLSDNDRIRSDSASRIDNPWGFPSYAMSEALACHRPGPLLRVLAEPVLCAHYSPRAAHVYQGVDREGVRIGWASMVRPGTARVLRRRAGGGFFVGYNNGADDRLSLLRCTSVHLALGHAGLARAEVQPTEIADGVEGTWTVHAYEPHEDIYDAIAAMRDATVVVRGTGITASQVIHRLVSDQRRLGLSTHIIQCVRSAAEGAVPRSQLPHRPFSAPRSAFGGSLHRRMIRASAGRRRPLLDEIRQPTSPDRSDWRNELAGPEAEGWFKRVTTTTVPPGAHFVIDCTGFSSAAVPPLLVDITEWEGDGQRDLAVDRSLALPATRHVGGAVYLSGAAASDGPIGPVDSFWGLTYASFLIAADLRAGGELPRFGPWRSFRAWVRWVVGVAP